MNNGPKKASKIRISKEIEAWLWLLCWIFFVEIQIFLFISKYSAIIFKCLNKLYQNCYILVVHYKEKSRLEARKYIMIAKWGDHDFDENKNLYKANRENKKKRLCRYTCKGQLLALPPRGGHNAHNLQF